MRTEKLIHDIPFVIEAGKRVTQVPKAPTSTKAIVEDEMHAVMSGVEIKVDTSPAMPRVRFLSCESQ